MATIIRAGSSSGGGGDCATPAFLTASLAALRVALETDLNNLQSALETAITTGNDDLLTAIESDLTTLGSAILTAISNSQTAIQNDVAAVKSDTAAIKLKTDNLPASPASQTKLDTVEGLASGANGFAAIKTDTAAIKAKTDNLPASPASQTKLDTVEGLASGSSGFVAIKGDTAAIKAKTDNLPADPSSAATLAASFAALTPAGAPATGTSEQTTGVSSTFSAYSQLVASLTKACPGVIHFNGSLLNNTGGATKSIIQFATGGAGSEVVFAHAKVLVPASGYAEFTVVSHKTIAAGTRVSYRSYVEAATGGTLAIGFNIPQVA